MRRMTHAFCCGCILLLVNSFSLAQTSPVEPRGLQVRQDELTGKISVYRAGQAEPILTQNARKGFRPYLHPIVAPDGRGVLTEYSPGEFATVSELGVIGK